MTTRIVKDFYACVTVVISDKTVALSGGGLVSSRGM
jgi:hypothetical protein